MAQHLQKNQLNFSVGDTVRVHQSIQEGDKKRIQIFEGVVIAIKNRQSGSSYTVRRIASGGVGVEKIFPAYSPVVKKVERIKRGDVRRAKLYYIRDRLGKAAMNIKKKIATNK